MLIRFMDFGISLSNSSFALF